LLRKNKINNKSITCLISYTITKKTKPAQNHQTTTKNTQKKANLNWEVDNVENKKKQKSRINTLKK